MDRKTHDYIKPRTRSHNRHKQQQGPRVGLFGIMLAVLFLVCLFAWAQGMVA